METKESAGYVIHTDTGPHRCSTCEHYTEGTCEIVMGLVEPYGGCNYYKNVPWVVPE